MFSKFKRLIRTIQTFDKGIYQSGADFAEVYARNAQLEEEIEQKTKDLEQTNQTILTLSSVWDMMNSPQPLANVLDKISDILSKDMDYIGIIVFQIVFDDNGKKSFVIKANSKSMFTSNLEGIIGEPFVGAKLPYVEKSNIVNAIEENKIRSFRDIHSSIKSFFPNISEDDSKKIAAMYGAKTEIVLPLYKSKSPFGCVMIYSPRNEISDIEMNFLSLFSNQIELGITVAELFEEIKQQAVTDPLTQIYNRRFFESSLIKEAERAIRQNQPFSIISLDLDYLKRINDTYGHQYGDVAIKAIASILKKESRAVDIYARIGGEEFNILLPGVDSNGAMIAAERIRKSIESKEIDRIGHITASIGVATFLEHSDRIDELIELADQAMYSAKMNGRNQVKLAQKSTDTTWQDIAISTFLAIVQNNNLPIKSEVADSIIQKLNSAGNAKQNTQEILCSIADIIEQTYNQMYRNGTTKSKVLLASILAKRLNLSKSDTDDLKIAMLLYDIGNIKLPKEILNKKSELNPSEMETIKQHPIVAAKDILEPVKEKISNVIGIIENHHERWDGQGYPNNIAENHIPITSQIVLLVDAFSAMTQDRPYRKAYTLDETLDIIRGEAGKQWNKDLVNEFFNIIQNEQVL